MRRGSRHSFQIMEWPPGRNLEIMRRSALGMIRVYNLIPQEVVDKADVKSFQSALTQMLRDRVNGGDDQWRWFCFRRDTSYSNRIPCWLDEFPVS